MGEKRRGTHPIPRRMLLQGALAGSIAALPGCASGIRMDPRGWGNVLGTTYALPRWQWAPAGAGDVVSAVKRAEAEKRRIRMTGSGYSFSDVAVNDDWLLSPRRLTQVFPTDGSCLRAGVSPDALVRVQTGVTVRALNAALDARGLALTNMGAFDKQTFVGAASTGTHGSGMGYGPLASQIVSIQVVGPGGEMLQVEPSGGITDPARFTGRLPEAPNVGVALRQEDALFDALAVSLGCLGVIYAVTLRATTKFWLVERRTMTTWEELSRPGGVVDRIVGGLPLWPVLPDPSPLAVPACIPAPRADPEHVEINYTPYPDPNGEHVALLTLRWRTTCRPPSVGGVRGSILFDVFEEAGLLADKVAIGILPAILTNKTAEVRHAHVVGMMNLAEKYYANRSYQVFQIGILDDLHVYGIELHFDAQKTKAIVARNLLQAGQLAGMGMHHSSPPTLRFIAPARPLLSMENGRPGGSVAMEFGMFTDAYGAEELLRSYESAFVGGELGGRPHWGLDRNYLHGEAKVRELYPQSWDSFKGALEVMNPNGTFNGRVTDRLGISRPHG